MPRILTPLLGGAYISRTRLLAAQRAINIYPELVDTKDGKTVGAFYGTPGLDLLTTIGDGPWRVLRAVNDSLWGVSGGGVYQVTGTYNGNLVGTIGTDTGPVVMVDNGLQLLIVDGEKAYGYDIGTNFFDEIALPFETGNPIFCAYQDHIFLMNQSGTQNWYSSDINNVFHWDASLFGQKDSQPDNLIAMIDNHREVWLLGSQTTEVWINAGQPNFPFAKLQGVFIQEGIVAPFSLAIAGPSLIWLSKSREGQGMVLQSRGYQMTRISTHAIEREIQSYPMIDDAIAYVYQEEGHLFYMLSFPSADVTWCYDASTGLWHQRAAFRNGEFFRHRSNCYALFKGQNVIGDFENGNLYAFNLNTYDDAGETRKWLRSWQAYPTGQIDLTNNRLNRLQIYMEPGVAQDTPPPIRILSTHNVPPPPPPVVPTMKIVKHTVNGNGTFVYTVTGASPAAPSITTVSNVGEQQLMSIGPGQVVNITEVEQEDWTLSSVTAVNATGDPYTLGLTPLKYGDDITVTFTNTNVFIPPPMMRIVKVTTDGEGAFNYTVTNATPTNPTISTSGGTATQELGGLVVGAVPNIVEISSGDWTLDSTVAVNARPGSPTFVLGTTALSAGDDVTVTFTNTPVVVVSPILYVGVSNAGPYTCDVVTVDTGTDTVVTTIPITPPSTSFATINALAITPDQTMVYAQTSENFGGLVGIDATTDTVSFYDNQSTGFSWTPVYVTTVDDGATGQLYMPNNRTTPNGRVLRLAQPNTLGTEIDVSPRRFSFAAASPDNAWVALTGLSATAGTFAFGIIDTIDDSYLETIVASAARFPIWLPDSASVYIARVQSSNTVIDRFDAPSFALIGTATPFSDNIQRNCIIMSPDGTTIYCAGSVDIAKVDAVSGAAIGSPVAIPAACNYLCFLPDGSKIYISTPSGLLPYDTATDTVGSNIAVGTNAQGMCVKS